ncbi:MAG: hypothetical protein ACRDQ9_12400 [Pseudonocardiaceae bacterium]
MIQIFGIDGGSPDVRAAEHLLAEIVTALGVDPVLVGCTHLTRTGGLHVTLSVELSSASTGDRFPPGLHLAWSDSGNGAAAEAAAAHQSALRGGQHGFPGRSGWSACCQSASCLP